MEMEIESKAPLRSADSAPKHPTVPSSSSRRPSRRRDMDQTASRRRSSRSEVSGPSQAQSYERPEARPRKSRRTAQDHELASTAQPAGNDAEWMEVEVETLSDISARGAEAQGRLGSAASAPD